VLPLDGGGGNGMFGESFLKEDGVCADGGSTTTFLGTVLGVLG